MSETVKTPESLASWIPDLEKISLDSEPEWLRQARRIAGERLRREPVPGPKQEAWRYTALNGLLSHRFDAATERVEAFRTGLVDDHLIPKLDAHRAVMVNGHFVSQLSSLEALPDGVSAASLKEIIRNEPELLRETLNSIAGEDTHLFAALNFAGLQDGFVLHLQPNRRLDKPLELIHLSVGMDEPRLAQPRHLLLIESGAQAQVIERYVSHDDAMYCTNNLLEIKLGADSRLVHHRVQEEGRNAFHLAGVYLNQYANSSYNGTNIALGASWSRTDMRVRFKESNSQLELNGLYVAGDRQLVDFHLDINHDVPECASREHFKGLLYGKGRAVMDGKIYVAQDAQKTDAHLKNANLILSRNAEVDTKPQLQIYADDVKCSHGATVGQLETDTLFYLRSRGIPEGEARRMLCLGFAGEIIESCGPPALQEYLNSRIGAILTPP